MSRRTVQAIAYNVGQILAGGLWLMLLVGVARGEWLPHLPTIGYLPAVLVCTLLRLTLVFRFYSSARLRLYEFLRREVDGKHIDDEPTEPNR